MIDFQGDQRGVQLQLLLDRLKYERHLASEVDRLLLDTFHDVADTMLSRTFRDLSAYEQVRVQQLFTEVSRQLSTGYLSIVQALTQQLTQYGALEVTTEAARLVGYLARASAGSSTQIGGFLSRYLLRATAVAFDPTQLPVHGLTITDTFDAMRTTMSSRTRATIQRGLLNGTSPGDIAREVVRPLRDAEPSLYRQARRDANTATRTVVNAVQNTAAHESYIAAGDELVDRYRYSAVRDVRTTIICIALDGNIYRIDDPRAPRPPQHYNCRSGIQPVLNGAMAKTLGIDAAVPDHGYADMTTWLRGESIARQNAILGVGRADLWRDGKITLKELIDADRRTLTLAELRERLAPAENATR